MGHVCHGKSAPRHAFGGSQPCDNRYGVVVGPVANDDLALLFRQFSRGLVTVEMLVREMRYKQLTVQYSFHTPDAIAALDFVGVDDVR